MDRINGSYKTEEKSNELSQMQKILNRMRHRETRGGWVREPRREGGGR
jgi:hypothetical protein